jgi:hypothetical protein
VPSCTTNGDRFGVAFTIFDLTDCFNQHLNFLTDHGEVLLVGDALLQFHQCVAALFGDLDRHRVWQEC